ncbi:MAG: putative LPS assembly protein LptD [Ekhidna sp.]|uniref:putative LPS assembly protein LptD n=1 Tax=Ekhidna sp. TaxID=2608089 RepID=UPI0032ECB703
MRCLIILFCFFLWITASAQELDSLAADLQEAEMIGDSLIPADSAAMDSTAQSSTQKRSDVETTINYNAKDSLFFNVKSRELFLYGDTHIDYGNIALDAERTDVDWNNRTLKARYITDSTGKKIGKPVFTEGPDTYVTDDIIYNFKTERAQIKGVITEQDGGFMHGEDVKKNAKDELFIRGAKYTTCNLEDPHFSIESTKIKAIPNNKVISGPFNMKFRDVPTPLFFPFGMFPQPKEKSSGIIVPSYGEERRRGFFLRNGGYYFAISDYVDLRLTGDIYSKGGNAVNAVSNYYKRYAFRGTFNFSYVNSVSDEIENPLQTKDYSLRWNHSPESRGNSSFSASVNAATSSYNRNNNLVVQDFNRSINSQLASSISYRKIFAGTPFNMSTNLRHSQNLNTGIVNLTLPDLTINMNRLYPFKGVVSSNKSPLSKLNFSHNFVAKNDLSNNRVSSSTFSNINVLNKSARSDSVITFNNENLGEIFDRSQLGGKHTIPISTSMSVLKYFTINPTFNYEELWYTKELQYEYIQAENGIRIDTVDGFSRAGSWSTGASLNTRVYGTAFFKKGKIQAIRHVMTPSVSFSYNPDFSDPKYGVYQDLRVDAEGNTRRVSRYEGFAYGSPSGGESKTLGFSLSNNIEMKVASKKDTVNGFKKVKLFENLGISSGYNLAADSFKLSNININARTSLLDGKISLNFTGSIDPYEYLLISESVNPQGVRSVRQRRLDRYAWNNGNGIGQLSNMNTSISFNLAPKGSNSQNTANQNNQLGGLDQGVLPPDEQVGFDGYSDMERQQIEHIQNNPEMYVDFDVPWSLRMQYSINRTKRGFEDPSITQSFQFSGSLGLTDKTQITFNSGYDFEANQFTTTRLGVSRDLHCWTMNFDWVPFGTYQSYFLSIRVKSAVLQDLKLEKRRSFFDFFN